MTQEQIQSEIDKLKAENSAIMLQSLAFGLGGGIAGAFYASHKGKSLIGKVGFFFLGSLIARIPVVALTASKASYNLTRIQELENQLTNKI